jgi:hypothetical protein
MVIDKWHILPARLGIELRAVNHRDAQNKICSCEGKLQRLVLTSDKFNASKKRGSKKWEEFRY